MALTYDLARAPDLSAFLRKDKDGSAHLELLVKGARCAACMSKIESAVASLPDVSMARLNLTEGRLAVRFASPRGDTARVVATLDKLG